MNYKCNTTSNEWKYIKETFNTCDEREVRIAEVKANPNMTLVAHSWAGVGKWNVTYRAAVATGANKVQNAAPSSAVKPVQYQVIDPWSTNRWKYIEEEFNTIDKVIVYIWKWGQMNTDDFNALKVTFCDIWQPYVPRLCQWIMDKTYESMADIDECKALFADDIERANRLYKLESHKKEILSAGIAFHK